MDLSSEKRKLEKIKETLETKKEKMQELEAERKVALKTLKEEYGLESVKEAEKFLEKEKEKLEENKENLKEEIEELYEELEEEGII